MIMGLLAKGLQLIIGPLLVPILILAGLWLGGQYLEARETAARLAGERACDARWEAAIRQQEQEAAARRLEQARAELEAERRVTEDLRGELDRIMLETNALRELVDRAGDGRCLSDGVLDELRRYTQPTAESGS